MQALATTGDNLHMARQNSLVRDVAVNVIANLIAGAIVYLLAVAAGYLKVNIPLVAVAAALLCPLLVGLLMFIVGTFRYILSNGDSKAVSEAKDSILYGIVALGVAGPLVSGFFFGQWLREGSTYGKMLALEFFLISSAVSSVGSVIALARKQTAVAAAAGTTAYLITMTGVGAFAGFLIH